MGGASKASLLSGLLGGLASLVDVAVDEVEVLRHPGVDARPVLGATAAKTDDSRLHEALGSATHQWSTKVPLWKHLVICKTAVL